MYMEFFFSSRWYIELGAHRCINLPQTAIYQMGPTTIFDPIFQGANQGVKPYPWPYCLTTEDTYR